MLAGGQSRRMGTTKALIPIEGVTLLERAVGAVNQVADEVFVVGGDVAHPLAEHVADLHPGEGPLGGLLSGLARARNEYLLLVSCDLPQLDPAVLGSMMDSLERSGADYVVPLVHGRRQWHCSAWHRRAMFALESKFATGVRSFWEATTAMQECAMVFADPSPFIDLDTAEELGDYLRLTRE